MKTETAPPSPKGRGFQRANTPSPTTDGKAGNRLIGAGVISAIAASLCCITPVLALIAGSSGIAASFSWLEPARPYLIGITVLVLGFAWYQKLKPKKADEIDCDCEEYEKPSFLQSKKFLGIVTIFAVLMTAFPYYSSVFYPEATPNVIVVDFKNIQQAKFEISGMTCTSCEEHIKHAVAQLPGFIEVEASYDESNATVKFDKSKSTIEEVLAVIDKTGYKVTDYKIVENQ